MEMYLEAFIFLTSRKKNHFLTQRRARAHRNLRRKDDLFITVEILRGGQTLFFKRNEGAVVQILWFLLLAQKGR
jgi:hypothetical protein